MSPIRRVFSFSRKSAAPSPRNSTRPMCETSKNVACSRVKIVFLDQAFVIHRHFPAGEIYQFCARVTMKIDQRRLQHRCSSLPVSIRGASLESWIIALNLPRNQQLASSTLPPQVILRADHTQSETRIPPYSSRPRIRARSVCSGSRSSTRRYNNPAASR